MIIVAWRETYPPPEEYGIELGFESINNSELYESENSNDTENNEESSENTINETNNISNEKIVEENDKMENSEEPKQTAIRETKEETGIIDVEFIDGFNEEISYTFYVKNEEIDKKVIFYLGKTKSTEIVLSHEHLDFAWLNLKDAMDRITYENAKIVLTKANNLLQSRI